MVQNEKLLYAILMNLNAPLANVSYVTLVCGKRDEIDKVRLPQMNQFKWSHVWFECIWVSFTQCARTSDVLRKLALNDS